MCTNSSDYDTSNESDRISTVIASTVHMVQDVCTQSYGTRASSNNNENDSRQR